MRQAALCVRLDNVACGMTIVKRMAYRTNPVEEWSNQYWFTGSTPADAAAWLALFNALTAQEKTVYPASSQIIRGYGYASDAADAASVYTRDLQVTPNIPISGTMVTTGLSLTPGDAAMWVRWKTSRTSIKGKPIYLRKYFHGALITGSTSAATDALAATQVTALQAFAAKLWDGTFIDGRTLTAQGHTDTIVGAGVSSYVTTRTLKRRGKRPGT